MSSMITPKRRGFLVALNSVVRHFGICVIPVAEIIRMESDAREDYEVMHRPGIAPRNAGYFNGLADYASKTADRLRTHYMPNAAVEARRNAVASDGLLAGESKGEKA